MSLKLVFVILASSAVYADLGIDIDLQSFHCDDNVGGNRDCNRRELDTRILVNGEFAIRKKRGWNIVVVDHRTGNIEAAKNFDTWGSKIANTRMESFITNIKNKRIVLGVAHDKWGYNMDHRGIRALNSITGSGFSIRKQSAAAFIGYKDSFALPDDFAEWVFTPKGKGPAHLHVIVGKIKYGNDMHFTLKSQGSLDNGKLKLDEMEGYLRYEGKKTAPQMGLSVLTIDHRTGKIFDENRFNVHDFEKAADDAVAYFQKLPRNLIVLGTVFADVTRKAGPKLPSVLSKITFTPFPKDFGVSWVFVGYTGGKSALPALDFPLARMTKKIQPKHLRRHFLKLHYFTRRGEVDECTNGQAMCGANTECRNTMGSYECPCKEDIDECQDGTAVCSKISKCINTAGSYKCDCGKNSDTAKHGVNCKDVSIAVYSSHCFHKNPKNYICKKLPIRIELDGDNLLRKQERGFKIIVLNSQTGNIEKSMTFDTWRDKNEGNKLVYALYTLEKLKIVVGAVMSDEIKHVPVTAWTMIKQLTGVKAPSKFMGAFAFIGFSGPGVPAWAAAKSTQLYAGPLIVKSRFQLLPAPPFLSVNIVSSGFTKSSIATTEIELQGKHLSSDLRPGFNIAVLSGWTGTLEAVRSFDTRSKMNTDVSKMVAFLNNLPVDRIVVGVVKGDGYSGIQNNADAQQALGRLIAAPASLKTTGSSYAFIGSTYTGTSKKPSFVDQLAVEPWKGPAKLSPIIGFGSKVKEITVKLVSTGCDDQGPHRIGGVKCHEAASSIAINGKELALNGRGINIVAISRISGHVLNRKRFDTARAHSEATKMVEFIMALPLSAVVFGVVKGDAYEYAHTAALKSAMKGLLGQEPAKFVMRGAYAFIGYKGKVKEAWVQQKHTPHRKGGVYLTAKIPLRPELTLKLESMACDDHSAGDCNLNKNIININGKDYSRNGRGFNLAVIDFGSGDIEKTANFDTWDRNGKGSEQMEEFIKGIQKNKIVIGVIKDEGYTNLKMGAKTAIASLIHKRMISFDAYRQSYIFVGSTSRKKYHWVQEKRSQRFTGPTKLELGIPLIESGCVLPTVPTNGKLKKIEYDVTQEAQYRCQTGLRLNKRPQTCSKTGKWTGEVPSCLGFSFGGSGGAAGGGAGGSSSSSSSLQFSSMIVTVTSMTSLLAIART
eukprot:gene13795-4724_t